MIKKGLLLKLEVKPGREKDMERFLFSGALLAQEDKESVSWYSIKTGDSSFIIFNTFQSESKREAHLASNLAHLFLEKTSDILSAKPVVLYADIMAAKLPSI